jgi:hypothetical protein
MAPGHMTDPSASPRPFIRTQAPALFGWGMALLLLLALAIRLPLVGMAAGSYRLTEAFNIEEVENVRLSTGMLHKGTLHPHAYEYPSLFYELSLLVEAPLRSLGRDTWTNDLVAVRMISLAFGLWTVWLAGRLGSRLGGPWAGLIAAAIVAGDRTMIEISALAKPNAAQLAFLLAGFLALSSLAARPNLRDTVRASAWFALAAASKWLGALGLVGLALAPALGNPRAAGRGLARLGSALSAMLREPVSPLAILLPLVTFAAIFAITVPGMWLSPREFGFGLAQTFIAQSLHQRPLPMWTPLAYLFGSLGWTGAVAVTLGVVWGVMRLLDWDGTPAASGLLIVLGWALAYGALALFVFVKLPSYLDLWIPFLAVVAGVALAGESGLLRTTGGRAAGFAVVLLGGIISNGAHGAASAALARHDTRVAAGEWLAERGAPGDSVLADLGVFVPDRITRVDWNWWGSPPRVVYDESQTWGRDPIWPEWYGGHRRLTFENAKWVPADQRLARHPRWVLTDERWESVRAHPEAASESAAPDFDRALADGSAGYRLGARFVAGPTPKNEWAVLAMSRRPDPPPMAGPAIKIWERGGPR